MTIKHDLGRGNTFVMGLLIGSTAAILIHRIATSRRSTLPNEKCDSASLNDDQNNQIQKCLPPEIRSEMLSRNALYFASSNGMPRIESSHVLVVGLGGVGSHTAHMLARSGVGYIRMVDFDQVTLSSLNRHAVATLKDVGLPKAIVLARHLREICPDEEKLVLDPVVKMYTGDNERDGSMMDPPSERCQRWDLVIDAIDDVPTKANLIAYCAKRGIRVISCMGAGGKADPTRVHISDLRSASKDPLATSVRQKLRYLWRKEQKETGERNGKISGEESDSWLSCIDDDSKVAVVYSSEKVVAKLAQITDEQMEEGLHNFGAMDNMRVRVLPVVGTMPAIMGQTLAAMALCELGGKPFQPVGAERVGRNVRHKLYQHLCNREKKIEQKLKSTVTDRNSNTTNDPEFRGQYTSDGTYIGPVQIDADDVEYIMAELWRNKCAVTGVGLGTVMSLVRWDRTRPAAPDNLVLMCSKAVVKFDQDWEELGDGRNGVEEERRRKIEGRLKMCALEAEIF